MKTLILLAASAALFFSSSPVATPYFKTADVSAPLIKRQIVKHTGTGEYEVTVTISKGSLNSFASYKETIPGNGNIKVEGIDLAGSDFKFDESKRTVKFLWVALASSDNMTVSYKLSGISNLKKDFPGEFKYVEDNAATSSSLKAENVSYSEVK